VRVEAQPLAGLRYEQHFLHGPGLSAFHIVGKRRRRKIGKRRIVSGVRGHKLTLEMRRQLRHLKIQSAQAPNHFIAVVLALGSAL